MKNKDNQDERIIMQKQKIGNEALRIVFFGLILLVLIQQYVFNAPFAQYAAEIILFIGISIYIVIRSLIMGNNLFTSANRGHKTVLFNCFITGIVVAGISTTVNYMRYSDNSNTNISNAFLPFGITFVSAFAVCFGLFQILYFLNKRKQTQIDKKLDEDEK